MVQRFPQDAKNSTNNRVIFLRRIETHLKALEQIIVFNVIVYTYY